MSDVIRRVWEFWTVPVRAEPLAAFRIAVGALLAIDTSLTLLPHAAQYLGVDGLHPSEIYTLGRERPWSWGLLPGDATLGEIRFVLIGLIAAATCVALGLATPVSSVLMWALVLSVHRRAPYVLNGGDFLLQAAALYLVLMPSGAVWSLDARIRRRLGVPAVPKVRPWGLRLAQIQLAVTYLFTGLAKLPVAGAPDLGQWVSGHAIAGALATPTVARFEFLTWLPWWLFAPVTWMTLGWELTFPILLLFTRSRYAALAFGVLLHLGIFATLEVNVFSFAVLCYYPLFLPTQWFGPATPPLETTRSS